MQLDTGPEGGSKLTPPRNLSPPPCSRQSCLEESSLNSDSDDLYMLAFLKYCENKLGFIIVFTYVFISVLFLTHKKLSSERLVPQDTESAKVTPLCLFCGPK